MIATTASISGIVNAARKPQHAPRDRQQWIDMHTSMDSATKTDARGFPIDAAPQRRLL
jgi:hypothetical protein